MEAIAVNIRAKSMCQPTHWICHRFLLSGKIALSLYIVLSIVPFGDLLASTHEPLRGFPFYGYLRRFALAEAGTHEYALHGNVQVVAPH